MPNTTLAVVVQRSQGQSTVHAGCGCLGNGAKSVLQAFVKAPARGLYPVLRREGGGSQRKHGRWLVERLAHSEVTSPVAARSFIMTLGEGGGKAVFGSLHVRRGCLLASEACVPLSVASL